jgi:tetratricopeptide (TPR) repeat protein
MKITQSRHSPWLIAPIVLIITTIAILSEKATLPIKPNLDAYSFDLNLPGTTDRKQLIQREIELYQTKLLQDPNSGMNLAALGNAYWQLGKATGEVSWFLLAEQTANRSIATLPFENASARLTLAQVSQARHDFKTAQNIALDIIKTKPKDNEARSILVTCALATGDLLSAETQANIIVNESPDLNSLTLQALVEEAQGKLSSIETFRLAIKSEEVGEVGPSALVRVLLGRHFYHQGNLDQAEFLYQEALRILPRYPLALINLATIQTRRGQYAEADRTYDQIISYSQQSTNIYDHTILRGKARLKQLQNQPYDDLLQKAEALLRKDTNAGHATGAFGHRRELAQLLLDRHQNNDLGEALALMKEDVKVRHDSQTYAVLARAFMVNDRIPEAREAIQIALNSGIKSAGIFKQASDIEQRLGNIKQSKIYSANSQNIDPDFEKSLQALQINF